MNRRVSLANLRGRYSRFRTVAQVGIAVRREVVVAAPRTAVLPAALVLVKALVLRPKALRSHVPLASEERGVPALPERFGHGDLFERHPVRVAGRQQHGVAVPLFRLVAPARADVVGDAQANRVLAGHNAGAGRGADRTGGVGLGEAGAGLRQPVDVGRFVELAAVAAEVTPAEIVGQEEDDVGWGGR